MPDPQHTEWRPGIKPHPPGYGLGSLPLSHNRNSLNTDFYLALSSSPVMVLGQQLVRNANVVRKAWELVRNANAWVPP